MKVAPEYLTQSLANQFLRCVSTAAWPPGRATQGGGWPVGTVVSVCSVEGRDLGLCGVPHTASSLWHGPLMPL